MALDVILNNVVLSLIPLSLAEASVGSLIASSSLSALCKAAPCLAMRSLHVFRSSSLPVRIRSVLWNSLRSTSVGISFSSSANEEKSKGYIVTIFYIKIYQSFLTITHNSVSTHCPAYCN